MADFVVDFKSNDLSQQVEFGETHRVSDGGYERGFAEGEAKGYDKGVAKVEADNAEILADCNEVLPQKGVNTADNLNQVPQRIGEIQSYSDGYDAGLEQGKQAEHAAIINPNWTNWSEYAKNARPELITCLRYSDTANGVNFESFALQNGGLLEVPPIDTSNGENFKNMFFFCRQLHTIGELNLSKATDISQILHYCDSLVHIHFVPGSIRLSLSMSRSSMLDDTSIQDTIDGLFDLTGATAQTLTLHATVGAKLTDEQKATITAKNWTLVY